MGGGVKITQQINGKTEAKNNYKFRVLRTETGKASPGGADISKSGESPPLQPPLGCKDGDGISAAAVET